MVPEPWEDGLREERIKAEVCSCYTIWTGKGKGVLWRREEVGKTPENHGRMVGGRMEGVGPDPLAHRGRFTSSLLP